MRPIFTKEYSFFKWVGLVSLVTVLALVGCTATPPPETVTLKLTWAHSTQFLGFYIAQERGFYADEGLVVTIEPLLDPKENAEIPARVAAGEFDFSIAARPVLLAQSKGVPVTVIALIGQLSPLAFFARADSGINTPADLSGRRVAVMSEVSRRTLETLLQQEGLSLTDVETVPSGFDMTPFYEGEVDVWVGYLNEEVIRAREQGLELVTFPLYEYNIMYTTPAIYTSRQIVETNPDLAVRFLRASLRGWEWTLEHPPEAVDIFLDRFPDLAAEYAFHQTSFDAYIPLIRPPGTRFGALDCQRWVRDELFAALDTTKGLCTTHILETVWASE